MLMYSPKEVLSSKRSIRVKALAKTSHAQALRRKKAKDSDNSLSSKAPRSYPHNSKYP